MIHNIKFCFPEFKRLGMLNFVVLSVDSLNVEFSFLSVHG